MREKLIKLLCEVQDYGTKNTCEGWSITVETKDNCRIADHLIANGVTLDNQVSSSKWIPVSERLPKRNEKVLVCDAREDYVSMWECFDGGLWLGDEIIWETEDITHWMHLPELPKEDK